MPRHLISGAHEWINSLVVHGLFTLVNLPWTTRSSPFPWGELYLRIVAGGNSGTPATNAEGLSFNCQQPVGRLSQVYL